MNSQLFGRECTLNDNCMDAVSYTHLDVYKRQPVTPELLADGVVIAAEPLTKDQVPVPTVGVFPAKVNELLLQLA